MIHALILDFDGLILDTESPALQSWQQIYGEYGQTLQLAQWIETLGTNEGFDPASHLAELLSQQQPPQAVNIAQLATRHEQLHWQLSAQQPLLPGVLDLLNAADAHGLPCAVASSSNRDWVAGWLETHGIRERFVCLCTADDVERTKPAPDLFRCAAACLQHEPAACLVFEDSPNGIRAAQAAGMPCVAVPGAISSQIELPPADVQLATLHAIPLADILRRVAR
jgi:HAD superfamily hydrolase (TIGR01509 family)